MTTRNKESTYNIKYVHFVCKYSSNPYIHNVVPESPNMNATLAEHCSCADYRATT